VDLKATVNLPKTAFAMKANLPQNEPKMLAQWEEQDLYGRIRRARAGAPVYVLHDGPPYANGNVHLGTAFNKILKDFIVKSKSMAGFDAPYLPGWDCHGLPIEIKVDQQLGAKKAAMSALQIRAACRRYAEKYVQVQRKSFQRLGVLGEWNQPYLTMSAQYEAVIAGAFVEMLARGYVFKGLKPVHWCLRCQTALAEAEVEYENHTSPSIWVRFDLPEGAGNIDPALAGRRVSAIIWTTTPWTIPSNMAIAFHPRFEYVAAEAGDGNVYIVAKDLLAAAAAGSGFQVKQVLATFPGARLDGLTFRHPFLDRSSRGILAEHVTLEQGAGAVHTAPGHGHEDFASGQQYGIPIYCPVGGDGRFFQAGGVDGALPEALLGKTVWEANPAVVELLGASGALLGHQQFEHSYPHCWRCRQPTILRATEQWFVGMERNNLRQRTLEEIQRIHWSPEWGRQRISNMIATRPDWCISRQRTWGVPIIVFYCLECQAPLTERAALDGVVRLFAEHTADVWYQREAADLLPAGTRCPACGGSRFRKETDILDVWFDSGSSHLAVLGREARLPWPSDMYIEAADQYRGWFHSSLLVGVALKGRSPYRASATHGWVLDAQGLAMSKSSGTAMGPEEIVAAHGAEILRLWAASIEFREDTRLSEEILSRLTEAYRKLRNTFRWMLGNLYDFDPQADAVSTERLLEIDQWVLWRAEAVTAECRRGYDDLEFHKVYHALLGFATVDLSAVYFDISKDRLYTSAPASPARRCAQTALWRLARAMSRLLAPLASFTCEEVWANLPRLAGDPDSVHVWLFPAPEELTAGLTDAQRTRLANWERLLEARSKVLKALEQARQEKFIGNALEARLRLATDGQWGPLLEDYRSQLPTLFIVSQVGLETARDGADLDVKVERADGTKCERCWKYSTDVGSSEKWPTICAPCASAVEEIQRGQ